MMLHFMHRIALKLQHIRHLCLAFAVLGFAIAAYCIADAPVDHSSTLRSSIIFTVWMLMLFTFITLFQHIPPPVLPGLGLFERAAARLRLWFFQLLGITVILLSLMLLGTSFKLLMLE